MSGFTLALRQTPASRVDAAPLSNIIGKSSSEIALITLRTEHGDRIPLGDLFRIEARENDAISIEGDLSAFDDLGAAMTSGVMFIDGDVGNRAGSDLAGGRITITGNAGHDTGSHMSGGVIIVDGDVGDRTGSARPGVKRGMTGGEIIILGNAGHQTGAFLRRGTIAVAGGLGQDTLHAALAGTVLTLGDVGAEAGRLNKRASLISFGDVNPPGTYRYACTYSPVFVRVLLRHLRRSYNFPAASRHFLHPLERYCGDFAELGRGEILRAARDAL